MALPSVITMEQVNPIYDESGTIIKYENWWQSWHNRVMFYSRPRGSTISPRWQQLFLTGRAFVFSETSTGKLLVVLIRNPFSQLSFARVGDDEWAYLPQYQGYENCTYKDGLLYAVTTLGEIHAIDLSGPIAMVKAVMGKVMDIGDGNRNTYILHAPWGDVLQIWKTEEDNYVHPSEYDYDAILKNTASIEVSDLVEEKLVKINHLQDHVLFVGHNQTLCLCAEEFPSLKANHAYFTDDSQNWITEFKNNRRDIGVFNLEDNSTDELVSPQLWSNWPSPSNVNLRTREWQHGGNPPSCGVADQGLVSGSHQKKVLAEITAFRVIREKRSWQPAGLSRSKIFKHGKAVAANNALDYAVDFSHMLGLIIPKCLSDYEGGNVVCAHTGHLKKKAAASEKILATVKDSRTARTTNGNMTPQPTTR
uniref:KIB1-4 beta-propeller domain-containing protein n=1 Tax=Oryza punctata TaxID=4537 RepID=A0A0E0K4X5_ORYPU